MNNWNYTECIPIVPHYLINNQNDPSDHCDFGHKKNKSCQQITMSKHTMASHCDVYCTNKESCQQVTMSKHTMPSHCDIYRTNKESCKQKNALCAICNEYNGSNCPASILKYNSSCSLHCVVICVFIYIIICLKLQAFSNVLNDLRYAMIFRKKL